jgi:hypothetical protein
VVKAVYVDGVTSYMYSPFSTAIGRFKIGKASVGYFPLWLFGEGIADVSLMGGYGDFWRFARMNGWNFTYPVPEGQKFIVDITNLNGEQVSDTADIFIIYDRYDASDIKGTEENGPYSDTLWYFNYLTNSESVGANEEIELDYSYLPAEYAEFPAGVVPSKSKITVMGIMGKTAGHITDSSNYAITSYLKMYYRRRVLFDDDLNGLPFRYDYGGAFSIDGMNVLDVDAEKGRFGYVFNPALEFYEGDELTIAVKTEGTGSDEISENSIRVAVVLKIESIR